MPRAATSLVEHIGQTLSVQTATSPALPEVRRFSHVSTARLIARTSIHHTQMGTAINGGLYVRKLIFASSSLTS